MLIDISKRIEELEGIFDENFGNFGKNILEKGIFVLKKLLFINPDKNNDKKEADLHEFTGLVMVFNLIEKNVIKNQEFAKNLRQSNLKGPEKAKMRGQWDLLWEIINKEIWKRVREENNNLGKSKSIKEKDDEMKGNNDNSVEKDFWGKTVKKRSFNN